MGSDDKVYGGTSKAAVARRLELTRTFFSLSQKDFAARADLSPSAYNHIEVARTYPSVETAIRICDAYQITLDWIYRGEPSGLPDDTHDGIHSMYRTQRKIV